MDEIVARSRYPDGAGGPLEDRAILRNAIEFSTQQRFWRALQTLTERLYDYLNNTQRAMLAFEGSQAMMVSLEDIQAWIFVLRNWRPGCSEGPLFALLDSVCGVTTGQR